MMEPGNVSLKLRSHNINGFDSSQEYLYNGCNDNSFSLLAIQEHWLRPSFRKQKGINRLKVLHPDYDSYATSGMEDQIDQRVLRGRPFGGTGFLFRKELSRCVRARVDYKHKRVTVMEISSNDEKILLINGYLPFYNTDNNQTQLTEYRDTLAFIENVMSANPLHKFILLMDLNCNIFGPTHPYATLVRSMMSEFKLVSSFEFLPGFDPNQHYTRFDYKRNSFTLIDGILVSESLTHLISSCQILHPPDNVSDHLPIEITINVKITDFLRQKSTISSFIPWSTLSEREQLTFRDSMLEALNNISIPFHAFNHASKLCDNCDCISLIERYYQDIVAAVEFADRTLPRRKHGIAKHFWSPELTALKQKSLDAHTLWKDCNCPRSGPIYIEKVQSHYRYKSELRKSKKECSSNISDKLGNNLLDKDNVSFWKQWKEVNGGTDPPSSMINGFVDFKDIADTFADTYKAVYIDSDANDMLRDKFSHLFPAYAADHADDCLLPYLFSWSDMVKAVFSLQCGKATSTFIKAEHIFLGCPELLCHLHLLFNGLLSHSYLPYDFLCGTISPIIKDANGDLTTSSNYRPVTLGPILSQLFEYLLFNNFGHFLSSDELQFGFKKSHSTSHAIFMLRSCVEYYTKHGSTVLVAFLDCSKAFDTISHYGVFNKLIDRKVPLCFLKIVMYMLLNMKSRCHWRGSYSDYFSVSTGTKQGGVISPRIFTMYMDELIQRLRKKGVGCHIINLFLACIFYADDLCLVAPSRGAMQEMLNVCNEYCSEFCLTFNVKKSKILLISKQKDLRIDKLSVAGKSIEYVKEWKYLGVTVVAGTKLSFSSKPVLSAFYRSVNCILSSLQKPNELVLINLLYSNCFPILSYAAEAIEFSSGEMRDCNTALNDAIRRIFGYHRWESIRSLRLQLGFPNVYEAFQKRFDAFILRNLESANSVVAKTTALFVAELMG